jgi:hypothetical protein
VKQPTETHHFRAASQVVVRAGEDTALELMAEGTAKVEGRVVVAKTRVPVEGAEVRLNQYNSGAGYSTGGEDRRTEFRRPVSSGETYDMERLCPPGPVMRSTSAEISGTPRSRLARPRCYLAHGQRGR